jgi:hypothetical protein
MKGLAWYCRVIFSLFILDCLALAVMLSIQATQSSLQPLVGAGILVILGVLTGLCFNSTEAVLRKNSYDKKRWAIYGVIWTSFIILLPFFQLFSTLSQETATIFMILTALYEWTFVAISFATALLFIPALIFFSKYLIRTKKSV